MKTPVLHIDFETRSELDLRQVGLYNYARHPSTDVWCIAWAFEGDPIIWHPELPWDDVRVSEHVLNGGAVMAHNAPFELAIWNEICSKRYGWPRLMPEQTYCTMAMAYAMGLPGGLEDAALALGLSFLKDAEGRALMLRMCRPRSVNPTVWWDEPEKLARLYEYCKQDVRVERELEKRLMPLSDRERKIWLLDYKINQRGVQIDLPSTLGAIKLADAMKEKYNAEIAEVTGGAATTCTALGPIKDFLNANGCPEALDGLAKQDVIDLLGKPGLSPVAERVLVLRSEAGKASTAKFDVMARHADANGRLHNLYQYHGAATGRWAGRGVQVHNLVRDMPKAETVETILRLVREGNHDAIDAIFGPPLSMVSRCMRSFFVAPPGRVLISGDWSNVESRGAAWFSGENWKLEAFKRQDDGTGPDVYKIGASRLLGITVEQVTKEQRQSHGKVPDLAFQYQGGVGSGKTMGKTYGVKATDDEWGVRKNTWRAAHPAITAVWPAIQRAAIAAVQRPGEKFTCGVSGRQAAFKMVGSFLWCRLPSERAICFPYPKILQGEFGPQLTYMAVPDPSKPGKVIYDPHNASNWARVGTYGGALLNRIVQGFCRDFLAGGMLTLDEQGAELVLHTHDSLAIEIARAKAVAARDYVERVMCAPPAWAQGFPLIAKPEIEARFSG